MSKRAAAPSPSLSRERILRGALDVIEREGLAALSMRRLAQELDVWPMAVYRYFRDKDELLDAVAAHSAAAVEVSAAGGSLRDRLRALLRGAHDAMAHEPAGLGGGLARAFLTPEALRLTESALTILREAGLSKREAASAWRSLWSYTYGFATFQVGATADETRRRTRAAIGALSDEEFPTLLDGVNETADAMADAGEFDYGLDRLLDAIEARAAR
jgi:AcrR family transcriptional regulator